MQLPGDRADLGIQQTLDQRVDVFVRRAHGRAIGELIGDAIETVEELRLFSS